MRTCGQDLVKLCAHTHAAKLVVAIDFASSAIWVCL